MNGAIVVRRSNAGSGGAYGYTQTSSQYTNSAAQQSINMMKLLNDNLSIRNAKSISHNSGNINNINNGNINNNFTSNSLSSNSVSNTTPQNSPNLIRPLSKTLNQANQAGANANALDMYYGSGRRAQSAAYSSRRFNHINVNTGSNNNFNRANNNVSMQPPSASNKMVYSNSLTALNTPQSMNKLQPNSNTNNNISINNSNSGSNTQMSAASITASNNSWFWGGNSENKQPLDAFSNRPSSSPMKNDLLMDKSYMVATNLQQPPPQPTPQAATNTTAANEKKKVRFSEALISPQSLNQTGPAGTGIRGIQSLTSAMKGAGGGRPVRPSLTEQLASIGSKADALTADIRSKAALYSGAPAIDARSAASIADGPSETSALLFTIPSKSFFVGNLTCRYPSPCAFYTDRCEYSFAHPFQSTEILMTMFYRDMINVTLSHDSLRFKLVKKLSNFPSDYDPSNNSHNIIIQLVSTLAASTIREKVLPLFKR